MNTELFDGRAYKSRLSVPQQQAIVEAYKTDLMEVSAIEAQTGVSDSRIYQILKLWQVPTRVQERAEVLPMARKYVVVPRSTGNEILAVVCRVWGVTEWDIVDSGNRGQREALPRRQAAIACMRKGYYPVAVGRWLKRHHTSIHHARSEHKTVMAAASKGVAASRYIGAAVCAEYANRWLIVAATLGITA